MREGEEYAAIIMMDASNGMKKVNEIIPVEVGRI